MLLDLIVDWLMAIVAMTSSFAKSHLDDSRLEHLVLVFLHEVLDEFDGDLEN